MAEVRPKVLRPPRGGSRSSSWRERWLGTGFNGELAISGRWGAKFSFGLVLLVLLVSFVVGGLLRKEVPDGHTAFTPPVDASAVTSEAAEDQEVHSLILHAPPAAADASLPPDPALSPAAGGTESPDALPPASDSAVDKPQTDDLLSVINKD